MLRKVGNMPGIETMYTPYKMFILLKSVLSRKMSSNKNTLNQERESVHWCDFGEKKPCRCQKLEILKFSH